MLNVRVLPRFAVSDAEAFHDGIARGRFGLMSYARSGIERGHFRRKK